ncbi:MAG: RNA-binding protein [Ignavibacteriaceae bacterium]
MSSILFIGSLPWSTNEDTLKETFGEYGKVVSATVVRDRQTERSRGFGFVKMENEEQAHIAIEAFRDKGAQIIEREGHEKIVVEAFEDSQMSKQESQISQGIDEEKILIQDQSNIFTNDNSNALQIDYNPKVESEESKKSRVSLETFYCKIYDVDNDYILASCMINQEKNLIEKRKFKREMLEGILQFYIGETFKIKVFSNKGEIKFKFEKDDSFLFREKKEDNENMFDDLENYQFFKPISSK